MGLFLLFGAGFSTGLSGAMIPGPLTFFVVSEAFRQGQIAGIKAAAGHLLLESGFCLLILLGLRDSFSTGAVRTVILWTGCVSLVAMGLLLLRRLPRLSLAQRAPVAFRGGTVAGGAFFSLTSPGFLLWWATIGAPVLLEGSRSGAPGIALVASGHALADLLWCWFLAVSVEQGRAYCSDRSYRIIMGLMAVCLIMLGVGLPLKP